MAYLKWIARLFWYGLYAYLALSYYESVFRKAWDQSGHLQPILFAKAILGLVLLTAFFVLVDLAMRTATQRREEIGLPISVPSSPTAYPSEIIVRVGVYLLALTGFLVLGLFFILNSVCWPDWIMKCVEKAPDFTNGLATMFGAGIGASVATILGYLEHASEKKDFDVSYAPWYVARPLMGMLLGLIFYFLLRDGLLAVVSANRSSPESLSEAGLTGVGALVGLFSKEAIEKLRELFNTLFATKKSVEQSLLERLPPDLKDKVRPFMDSAAKTNPKEPESNR
jgi:hypothetical protein